MNVIIEHRKIGLVQPDDPVGRFVDRLGKLVADQRLFDLQRRHLNRSYLDDTFGTLNGDRALGKDLRPVLRCAVRLGGFDILYQQLIVDCHLDLLPSTLIRRSNHSLSSTIDFTRFLTDNKLPVFVHHPGGPYRYRGQRHNRHYRFHLYESEPPPSPFPPFLPLLAVQNR